MDWPISVSGGQPEGAILSPAAIHAYAAGAGVTNKADRIIAVAIALAESGGDPKATHKNSDKHKTTDYGLWQINGYWHRDKYQPAELLTPEGNAKAMAQISKGGTDWSAWTTFGTQRYRDKLDEAEGSATTDVTDPVTGAVVGAVAGAVDAVTGAFTLDGVMGVVIGGVFVAGALAIVTVGLSKLTGVDTTKAVGAAGTAATVAAMV